MNDFKERLKGTISKAIVEDIALEVLKEPSLFDVLFSLTNDIDEKIAWRALWCCEKLSQKEAGLFIEKYSEIKQKALNAPNGGIQRTSLNILYHIDMPEEIDVEVLNFCIEHMTDISQTPACQAICMKMAFKICKEEEPQLLEEIKAYLENMETSYYTAAVNSARYSILKSIKAVKRHKR